MAALLTSGTQAGETAISEAEFERRRAHFQAEQAVVTAATSTATADEVVVSEEEFERLRAEFLREHHEHQQGAAAAADGADGADPAATTPAEEAAAVPPSAAAILPLRRFGDLGLEFPRASGGKMYQKRHGGTGRSNMVAVVRGRNTHTGARFFLKADTGRCDYVWLQYGNTGIYYNASKHGTISLALQTLAVTNVVAEDAANEEDVCEPAQTSRVLVSGPHTQGDKDTAAVQAVREFAERVLHAAGCVPDDAPLESMENDAKAELWCHFLQSTGVGLAAAQMLTVVFLPWLDRVAGLNDYVLAQWREHSYTSDIGALDTVARRRLEASLKDCAETL